MNKIIDEQAPLEERLKSRFEYESLKLITSNDAKTHDCRRIHQNDKVLIACTTESLGGGVPATSSGNSSDDVNSSIDELVRQLEARVEGGVDEDQDPTLRPRYSSYPPQPQVEEEEVDVLDCDQVRSWDDGDRGQLAIFISPADKGFE